MRIPRKLVISLITVVLAAGLVGTGALAYFQDTETSTDNTFTAGTLDLKLTDDNDWITDGVTASWTMENMAPGDTQTFPRMVMLSNSGSITGSHVEISFFNEIDENEDIYPDLESETSNINTPAEMAQWLEVTGMTYYMVNFFNTTGHILTDTNGNSFIDLDDLANPANAAALDNLSPPPANNGGMRALYMNIMFNSGAGNDFQGDTLITTITFTLNQDASQ
jgi:spore coat-associated protein N